MSGSGSDRVLRLHGIVRRSGSLASLERAIAGAGYRTLNLDYPARGHRCRDLSKTSIARRAPLPSLPSMRPVQSIPNGCLSLPAAGSNSSHPVAGD